MGHWKRALAFGLALFFYAVMSVEAKNFQTYIISMDEQSRLKVGDIHYAIS